MTTENLKTAGVEVAALGDFATVISGYAFKSSEFLEQGIPVIKIANIGVGLVDIAGAQCVSPDNLTLLRPKYQVHPRDILISLTGSQITQPNSVVGRVARQSSTAPLAFLNQRAGKVIVDDSCRCNSDYLYWALLNRDTRHQIAAMAHGAASQANVSPTQVESLKIRLPPFHVQRRIASILSAYDDLIENNTRRIAILEEMARRLYEEWFVRFRFPGHEDVPMVESELGLVPQGWQVTTLGHLAEVNARSVRRGAEPTEIQYIDISSVSTGSIDKKERMLFANAPGRARRVVRDGDVIWACVRPNRKSYSEGVPDFV
jgi:type I restriction enzyme S subunit